ERIRQPGAVSAGEEPGADSGSAAGLTHQGGPVDQSDHADAEPADLAAVGSREDAVRGVAICDPPDPDGILREQDHRQQAIAVTWGRQSCRRTGFPAGFEPRIAFSTKAG